MTEQKFDSLCAFGETPAGKIMAILEPVLTSKLRILGAIPVNYCEESIQFSIDGRMYELMVFEPDKIEVKRYQRKQQTK